MITNALSVDVEEYYHAAIFRRGVGGFAHGHFESRVERCVDRLLSLLDVHGARATFFVLGEIAARHPQMLPTIAAAGHEIGCHGDQHEDVYRQSPLEFRTDIRNARARIEDAISAPVVGYRAPNFSIGRAQQPWAYRILLEEGFRYDSSVHPIVHDRYGQPDAPRFPYEIWREGRHSLMEFPIGTARLLRTNLPVGGGGFFRLLPLALIRRGIHRVNAREQQPIMFYLHPWELDPDQPRPAMAWQHRFRLYVGLEKAAAKLSALLADVAWSIGRVTGTRGRASTIGLVALVAAQLFQTLVAGGRDPVVALAVLVSLAVLGLSVSLPGLCGFFGCRPLGPAGWAIALVSAWGATLAGAAIEPLVRRTSTDVHQTAT